MIKLINWFLKFLKLKLIQPGKPVIPIDADANFKDVFYTAKPYTMTSLDRMYAAYNAADYVVKNNIEGAVVECGVWRGGSAMVMAMRLIQLNHKDREFFLYDTYEGMTDPTELDVDHLGTHSSLRMKNESKTKGSNVWCYASLDEVKHNMQNTGYPADKLNYIQGKVEETIPARIPGKIALLRLDTDWYESTKHELKHLFPLLIKGGILIIDDYGHWRGSRQAVDEYFAEIGVVPFLNRIDYSGRLYVKL